MFYRASTVRAIERQHQFALRLRDEQIERLLDRVMILADRPMPFYGDEQTHAPDPYIGLAAVGDLDLDEE